MKQITIITGRDDSGKNIFIRSFAKNNKITKTAQKWLDVKTILKCKKDLMYEKIFSTFDDTCENATESDVIFIEDVVSLLDNDNQIILVGKIIEKMKKQNLKFVIAVNSLAFILTMKNCLIMAEIDPDCYVIEKTDDKIESTLIENDWETNDLLAKIYFSYISTISILKDKAEEYRQLHQ